MAMKRLFIVGCPRSGTTWTLMLLAQHPGTVAAQHVGFFHSLRHLEDWWHEHQKRKQGGFGKAVVSVAKEGEGAEKGVKFEEIIDEGRFYAMCRRAADDLFAGILERRPDAEVLVEKTPENVRIAPFIAKVYPDAYFLHIVRDPRAVYASLKSAVKTFEKTASFPGNPIAGARFWEDDVSRGVAIPEVSDRYLEVRYESLLSNGEAELARIYEWLGVPVDAAFCAKAVEAASMKNLRKIENAPKNFFRRGEADGWKEELTPEEIRILEYMLGDWLDRLGYERSLGTDVKKPVKVALEQQLQSTVNRIERTLVRTARRFGYVIPIKPKPHRKGR